MTGLSGTGKSSALAELERLGFRVVDTDDPGWQEYHPYAVPIDALHRGEVHWVEDRMTSLLEFHDDRSLFVAGVPRNQSKFYDRLDAVVLLSAPAEVMLDRVERRTENDYGKTPSERAEILADLEEIEPILSGSSISSTRTPQITPVISDAFGLSRASAKNASNVVPESRWRRSSDSS